MMRIKTLLISLFLVCIFSKSATAQDSYAEYKMSGTGLKQITSKMYNKNGDLRTEVIMDVAGRQMTTTTLLFKNKPTVGYIFNSVSKTYTEIKNTKSSTPKNFDIKIIGNEKVSNYNCTHVKMSYEGKSWDMWYTKDLPTIDFPVTGNDATANAKMAAQLKGKGISGLPIKIAYLKPNSNAASITMMLTKFENKPLASALFAIPAGYKKNSVSFDVEKMKRMTVEQKRELAMKMIKEQSGH